MKIIDVGDVHIDLDRLPINELAALARYTLAALRFRYNERRGKAIDEAWCIGCGIRKVSGEDKPGVRCVSCDDCKAAYVSASSGADPLRDILK